MQQLWKTGLSLALSVLVSSGTLQAAHPHGHGSGGATTSSSTTSTTGGNTSNTTKGTVSITTIRAQLTGGTGQTAATGMAQYCTVTVTPATTSTSTTTTTPTTKTGLGVCVKGLTLADGTTVTFNLNGTSIGTGTVKKGHAGIALSSVKGDTVPVVNSNDTITVTDASSTNADLSGTFGTAVTTTGGGGCGK